jgi:hypothetical protein
LPYTRGVGRPRYTPHGERFRMVRDALWRASEPGRGVRRERRRTRAYSRVRLPVSSVSVATDSVCKGDGVRRHCGWASVEVGPQATSRPLESNVGGDRFSSGVLATTCIAQRASGMRLQGSELLDRGAGRRGRTRPAVVAVARPTCASQPGGSGASRSSRSCASGRRRGRRERRARDAGPGRSSQLWRARCGCTPAACGRVQADRYERG